MFSMKHLLMGVYQVCSNKSPWVKIGPGGAIYRWATSGPSWPSCFIKMLCNWLKSKWSIIIFYAVFLSFQTSINDLFYFPYITKKARSNAQQCTRRSYFLPLCFQSVTLTNPFVWKIWQIKKKQLYVAFCSGNYLER
jgi:hypothetical protein